VEYNMTGMYPRIIREFDDDDDDSMYWGGN
jgi:hypothetical protein